VGLQAEPQLHGLAERIAGDFGRDLKRRFPEIERRVAVGDPVAKDPQARLADLVRFARGLLLERGWDLMTCLTDIPLLAGGRPLTARASATDGVALISVPALGAMDLDGLVRETAVDLIDALVGGRGEDDAERRETVRDRLRELAHPIARRRFATTIRSASRMPWSAATCNCSSAWCAPTIRGASRRGFRAPSSRPSARRPTCSRRRASGRWRAT